MIIYKKIDDAYQNLEDYNTTTKKRVLIVFDDMIADKESNKKLSLNVTEMFLRGRKLNISLAFMSESCFKVPKTIRINATHYIIMKNPKKNPNE